MPTEYGCARYKDNRTGKDAVIIRLFREQGCLILSKTATVEFACGIKPVHPPTRNPHDLSRSPGGSSSGSAAAVADWQVPLALGTQTGGSTTVPAAYCGVYGWKTSLGALPLDGAFSLVPSLDTVGFFARSAADLVVLAGALGLDPPAQVGGEDRPRIAWSRRDGEGPAEPAAHDALQAAVAALAADGFQLDEVHLPAGFKDGAYHTRTIFHKECVASFQSELDKGRDGIESEKFDIVALGRAISDHEYRQSVQKIAELRREFVEMMQGYDALLTFSVPHEAPVNDRAVGFSVFTSVWTVSAAPKHTLHIKELTASGRPRDCQS